DNRVSGDNLTNTFTSATFDDQNVGNGKTVTVTGISTTGADSINYQLTRPSTTTTADITPATLTGTADNKTRLYGETNPVFTVTYTGFTNGEDASVITGTLSGSTTATTNSPVGNYPITASGQSAPNYTINYVAGTLTITATPLLVAANDANRGYGQPNPAFTATFSGFVNGEDTNALGGALVFTTTANTNSPLGAYPIEVSGLTSTNYDITFSNGTLTVSSYALSVTADNLSRPYGAT